MEVAGEITSQDINRTKAGKQQEDIIWEQLENVRTERGKMKN